MRILMLTRRAAITLIAVMVHPTSSNAAIATEACALLTPAEAAAALGGSVTTGKSLATGVCQWIQQGKPGDTLLKLDVHLITPDHFGRLKSVTLGAIANVGGLGDEAFYSTYTQGHTTLTTLSVKKGTGAVTISVSGGAKSVEEYQTKEKAVALILTPKL